MSNISFLFRADNKNVGDWWCPPFRYFPFKPGNIGDVLNINFNLSDTSILIIGGGGIGSEYFRPHLKRIESAKIQHTVLWGGGVDAVIDISKILSTSE